MSDCTCKITIDLSNEPCGDGKDLYLNRFALRMQTETYDNLKKLLKEYEEKEFYEECAIIQQQIDFRVELAVKGYA